MKTEHSHNRQGFRRLIIFLVIAAMLLGVMPAYADTPEKDPFKGTVSLKLSTQGFGSTDMVLGFLDISLGIDATKKVADLKISLLSQAINLIVAWDNASPRFTVPEAGKEVYGLGKELLTELTDSVMNAMKKSDDPDAPAFDAAWLEKVGNLVLSFATPENMTAQPGSYTYEMLTGTVDGQTVTIRLSKESWKSFWKQFMALIAENKELLATIAEKTKALPENFADKLELSDEQLEELAKASESWSLTIFLTEAGVASAKLANEKMCLLYEGKGELNNRTDVFSLTNEGQTMKILENNVMVFNSNVIGSLKIAGMVTIDYSFIKAADGGFTLTLTFSYQDKGITLQALYKPGEVNIAVPGTPDKEITSMDDLTSVFTNVAQKAVSSLTSF